MKEENEYMAKHPECISKIAYILKNNHIELQKCVILWLNSYRLIKNNKFDEKLLINIFGTHNDQIQS